MNYEWLLAILTVATFIVWLLDKTWWSRYRTPLAKADKRPVWLEWFGDFWWVLLIVFVLRSFLFEPYVIPSSSLEPTLLIGDFILVNKFDYGIRLPLTHTKIIKRYEPKRGDIVVFRYPKDPSIDYIKRVVGIPGDKLSYFNKVLYVNGRRIDQHFLSTTMIPTQNGQLMRVNKYDENLLGVHHDIYLSPDISAVNFHDVVVPKGHYFMMGDNRDDSEDSRYWGFMPEQNIVGKAVLIWMSWNNEHWGVRWKRLFSEIH